jgi:hypothetical protein
MVGFGGPNWKNECDQQWTTVSPSKRRVEWMQWERILLSLLSKGLSLLPVEKELSMCRWGSRWRHDASDDRHRQRASPTVGHGLGGDY